MWPRRRAGFSSFFGFAPTYTSGAASINGDDAIELFMSGGVVDVFGDINVDGTGDGRGSTSMAGPTATTELAPTAAPSFSANWSFSGPNALDGESNNATAATPFPIGAFSACELPVPVPDLPAR